MKNINKMIGNIDDDILKDIIAKCESHMVSPFKKKSVDVSVEEPEAEEDIPVEGEEVASKENDLEGMDLEDLLRMYKDLT